MPVFGTFLSGNPANQLRQLNPEGHIIQASRDPLLHSTRCSHAVHNCFRLHVRLLCFIAYPHRLSFCIMISPGSGHLRVASIRGWGWWPTGWGSRPPLPLAHCCLSDLCCSSCPRRTPTFQRCLCLCLAGRMRGIVCLCDNKCPVQIFSIVCLVFITFPAHAHARAPRYNTCWPFQQFNDTFCKGAQLGAGRMPSILNNVQQLKNY